MDPQTKTTTMHTCDVIYSNVQFKNHSEFDSYYDLSVLLSPDWTDLKVAAT